MDATFLKLLIDLLNVSGPSRRERPVADFILTHCRELGVHAREDGCARKIQGTAGNVLAWPSGVNPDRVPVLLACHMDTVEVGAERKIKVTSKGVAAGGDFPIGLDNRVGVALLLDLLSRENGNYACLFTAQEEIGMFGAEAFKMPKSVERIFNLDGSQRPGHFVLSTVGCTTFTVKLMGRPSHAGIAPNGGRSVIRMAAEAIATLPHGMPGHDESLNIGLIKAGTRSNVVPALAEITGEVRANSTRKSEALLSRVFAAFKRGAKRHGGGFSAVRHDMFKAYAHSPASPIARRCEAAIRAAGLTPHGGHYRGGSDANVFNGRGVPSINLSIGAQNPHSSTECADLKDLASAARILPGLIR